MKMKKSGKNKPILKLFWIFNLIRNAELKYIIGYLSSYSIVIRLSRKSIQKILLTMFVLASRQINIERSLTQVRGASAGVEAEGGTAGQRR